MIKEIIFDCFGVLTQDGWSVFLQKYATDETVEELRYLNKSVDSGQISFDVFVHEICAITNTSKAEAVTILVNSYHPELKIFELIKDLKQNYKIGLISNISSPITDYLPTAPMDLFDEQTLSYQAGVAKPSPEIFELHLRKTGTKPEETVFVDDREMNCESAKALGIKAIWYQNLEQLKKDLVQLGVKTGS